MNTKTKLNSKKLEPHPLGALFPPMGDEEYSSLKTGMKLNGFDTRHPIVLLDGKILEGNNRYTAASATKTAPAFVEFESLRFPGTPIDYVIQENLSRRNLTPSQLSILGADLVKKMEEAEAAEKAEPANLQGDKKAKSEGEKVKKAAKMVKVSPRSVAKARALKKTNPKAAAEVRTGKKSLHKASKEAEKQQSAAQSKTEEYNKAVERIDKVCGPGWTLKTATVNPRLKSKDILQLSGIDKDEIKRVKPFLEGEWSLKDALGYKSIELSMKHTLGQATAFALSKGGAVEFKIGRWTFNAALDRT